MKVGAIVSDGSSGKAINLNREQNDLADAAKSARVYFLCVCADQICSNAIVLLTCVRDARSQT